MFTMFTCINICCLPNIFIVLITFAIYIRSYIDKFDIDYIIVVIKVAKFSMTIFKSM